MPNANKKKIFSIPDIKYVTLETCKETTQHIAHWRAVQLTLGTYECVLRLTLFQRGSVHTHDARREKKKKKSPKRIYVYRLVVDAGAHACHAHAADTPKRENDIELTLPVIKFIYLCNRYAPFNAYAVYAFASYVCLSSIDIVCDWLAVSKLIQHAIVFALWKKN